MAVNAIRCNISLPSELLEKIDKACEELGCARSVYIGMAVRAKLNSDAMFEQMPEMVSMMHDIMQMAKKAEALKAAGGSEGSGGGGA
jgi:metal-responsive CopG/Arc/MetJ family transcriptional regulator